jgi:cyclopropane fatty-acyl-phospholipid synthase-like methyltransferase
MIKPHSEACDRNQGAILSAIQPLLADARKVLEIGSGTGQHAVYFAARLPHLTWYCSDLLNNLAGIRSWIDDANLENIPEPLHLDVSHSVWPGQDYDAVYSANTTHIMSWDEVKAMITVAAQSLADQGKLILYGPFKYGGEYTSPSNEQFDKMLRQRDAKSGLRNFEELDEIARQVNFQFEDDVEMPANNRLLYWRKMADS